jgi:antitoxin component of RelBE/YafQ-DinJ toxin-antitoxin module
MPSKSTKSIAGRVDNNTYFNLMQMAKDMRMTLSQFIGYTLTNVAKSEQQLGAIPKESVTPPSIKTYMNEILEESKTPSESQQIPKPTINLSPMNQNYKVSVDAPPDITGYYTEEQVYRMALVNEKGVRGVWHNNFAIPKRQILRGDNYKPINNQGTELLEAYITGNSFYPVLYRRVGISCLLIDEYSNHIITFNGYDGIRYGTMVDGDYTGYQKWYYSYEDFNGNKKNVLIKLY